MLPKNDLCLTEISSIVNAWQRAVITRRKFLALDDARFWISAPTVPFSVLFRKVVAVFGIALRHFVSEYGFTAKFLFGCFETSAAISSRFGGAATSACDFGTSGWIHAPSVAGGSVALFSSVIAVGGATRSIEAWGAFAATLFDDLSVAWALIFQSGVHAKSNHSGEHSAIDSTRRSGSLTSAFDFLACITVHAPALASGAPVLGGSEKTVFIAFRKEVSYSSV
jgi:hypothetical protein